MRLSSTQVVALVVLIAVPGLLPAATITVSADLNSWQYELVAIDSPGGIDMHGWVTATADPPVGSRSMSWRAERTMDLAAGFWQLGIQYDGLYSTGIGPGSSINLDANTCIGNCTEKGSSILVFADFNGVAEEFNEDTQRWELYASIGPAFSESFYHPGGEITIHQWARIAMQPGGVEEELAGTWGFGRTYYSYFAEAAPEIPEPGTMALVALGLFGVALLRRRRA